MTIFDVMNVKDGRKKRKTARTAVNVHESSSVKTARCMRSMQEGTEMSEKEYIERDAVLNQMLHEMVGTGVQSKAMSVIRYANAADVVEVRYGHWRKCGSKAPDYTCCSLCNICFGVYVDDYNYCPNCGATMCGKEDEGK